MPDDGAAEWYDDHRDDLVTWAPDPAPDDVGPKRRRGAMVSARFTRDEVALLRVAAERHGTSLSALVREAALTFAAPGAAAPDPVPGAAEIRRIVREELADRAGASPSRTDSTIIELRPRTA